MKILIVEDEEVLALVLKEKLELDHFEVQTAADGEAGLAAVGSFRPDFILLDLVMPKKTGMEVLEELKASPQFKDIPVIVLSNLDTDADIKKALALGALDYFVKAHHPINEIVEKVKTYSLKPH